MSEESTEMQADIVTLIRDSFSSSGVSVSSYGRGNIVVEIPADFPSMSQLILELADQFGAVCDLSTVGRNPQLTVWYPEIRQNANQAPNAGQDDKPTISNAVQWSTFISKGKAAKIIMLLVGAMFIAVFCRVAMLASNAHKLG